MIRERLNDKKYIIPVIVILGVVIYLILGREWVHLEDDSYLYITCNEDYGVSPLYSSFLFFFRRLFGNHSYLMIVAIVQSIFAIWATSSFSMYIRKRFELGFLETIIVYVLCSLPYIIYFPDYGITHCILTEGIAYSLFYIYFIQIVKYMCEMKITNLFGIMALSILMAITRSQLMLVLFFSAFVVSGTVVNCYIKQGERIKKVIVWLGIFGATSIGCFIIIVGGKRLFRENILPEINRETAVAEVASLADSKIEDHVVKIISKSGQLRDIVQIKAFFEANPADVELFSDVGEQRLFEYIYATLDEKKDLHVHIRKGLYGWMDITKGDIPVVVSQCAHTYKVENIYDEIALGDVAECNDIATKMAVRLFVRHLPQIVIHSLRIMLMSVVASVFFQIEKIYLLCHIIAIGLYIALVVLMIRNKDDKRLWQLSKAILGFMLTLIIFTNLAFLGLQRYVVYGMGIFYIVLFLQLRKTIYDFIDN